VEVAIVRTIVEPVVPVRAIYDPLKDVADAPPKNVPVFIVNVTGYPAIML